MRMKKGWLDQWPIRFLFYFIRTCERSSSLLYLILFIEEFVFSLKSIMKCESWTGNLNLNFSLRRWFEICEENKSWKLYFEIKL